MTADLTTRSETGMDKTPNAVLGGTDDGRLRIHCPACEWDAVYGCLDLVSIQAVVRDHVASHSGAFEPQQPAIAHDAQEASRAESGG